MDSTETSRGMKEDSYFIANSNDEAFAINSYNNAFYFTSVWSNEVQKWRDKDSAKTGLAFYQKRAKELNLFDEFQRCKIMKASIIETRTISIVIENADDVGSSR